MTCADLDLCFLSVREMRDLYAHHRLSPVEVCQAVLMRIGEDDAIYNAMCLVDHDKALAEARASEKRWQAGVPLSALDGVPATIKDLVWTKDWPTLRGSKTICPEGPWVDDAPVSARLREAGAVLVGKTTTPEFGSKGVTDSPLTGITRNAWNPAKTSGGSSGGAAVAAARGYGALHLGSDGAGSIRIPSSFNHVFGLKPTFGRVPAYPPSPLGTLSHLGPMTRTVEDAAFMLDCITQPDHRDWFALPDDATDYVTALDGPMKGLKIAYCSSLGYGEVTADVAERCREVALKLKDLGAELIEIDPPLDQDPVWITNILWFSAFLTITDAMDDADIAKMDPQQQDMLAVARCLSVKDLLAANNARMDLASRLRALHAEFDLVVTPTMPITAFEAGQFNPWGSDKVEDWIRWSSFTYPFNLSQQPAASLPCGFDGEGLPVGLQIVGAKYHDALVLRAAKALEEALDLASCRPTA